MTSVCHSDVSKNTMRKTLRFYPGEDDDLIEWINALPRTETANSAIKAAVRKSLNNGSATAGNGVSLGEIRQVIEAALESYQLARRETSEQTEEDDRQAEILDRFSELVS